MGDLLVRSCVFGGEGVGVGIILEPGGGVGRALIDLAHSTGGHQLLDEREEDRDDDGCLDCLAEDDEEDGDGEVVGHDSCCSLVVGGGTEKKEVGRGRDTAPKRQLPQSSFGPSSSGPLRPHPVKGALIRLAYCHTVTYSLPLSS